MHPWSGTDVPLDSECPACGLRGYVQQGVCAGCSVPVGVQPQPSGQRATVVTYRQWGDKTGLVSGVSDSDLMVVRPDAKVVRVPQAKVREQVGATQQATLSLGGAWVLAAREPRLTGAGFSPGDVERHALGLSTGSLEQTRLFAADLVAQGRPDVLAQLPLGDWEKYVLVADADVARGAYKEAAEKLAHLPVGRFASRIPTVAALAPRLTEDFAGREALLGWLESWQDNALADVAGRYLRGDDLGSLTTVTDPMLASRLGDEAVQVRAALVAGRAPGFVSTLAPTLNVLGALISPGAPSLTSADLEWLPASILDDLIERGAITVAHLAGLRSRSDHTYLLARTDPSALSEGQLEQLGLEREQVRRALESGDSDRIAKYRKHPLARSVQVGEAFLAGKADESMLHDAGWPAAAVVQLARARTLAARTPSGMPDEQDLALPYVGVAALQQRRPEDLLSVGEDCGPRQRELVSVAGLVAARDAAWAARWPEALDHARAALRFASQERVRDEALNLVACSLWQQGKDEAAFAALERALEGEYTLPLVVNAAVVASELDPVLAAKHLSRVIEEASTPDLKMAAARVALATWYGNETAFSGLVDGKESRLPTLLVGPLRRLVNARLSEPDFVELVRTLSVHDATWLASPDALRRSPWSSSAAATYYVAQARGWIDAVKAMARLMKSGSAEAWLVKERDQLLENLKQILITEDDVLHVAGLAYEALDSHLPMDMESEIVLTSLAAREYALHSQRNRDSEPSARLADSRVAELAAAVQRVDRLPADRQEPIRQLVVECVSKVQLSVLAGLLSEITEVYDQYNALSYEGRRQAIGQVSALEAEWRREAQRLLPFVNAEVRDTTRQFVNDVID